jgi:Divergent InlB B-repeat domain
MAVGSRSHADVSRFLRYFRLVPLLAFLALAITLVPAQATGAQLTLRWLDYSGGLAGFKIERKTGTTGVFAQIATVSRGRTAFTDYSVGVKVTYCYRVRAYTSAGHSAYSNQACGIPATFDLTVSRTGTGAGTVNSSPAGISCGTDCFQSYPSGSSVTLTATPAAGSIFSGWSGGGCSGTGPCTLAGNSRVTVPASFNVTPTSPPGIP